MMNLMTKALQNKLKNVGTIAVPFMDREQGVKRGNVYTVQPSFKFLIVDKEIKLSDGKYKYETSEPKPFDCANILLVNRYKSKRTDDWVEEKTPALAINLKLDEQPDSNKVRYCCMMFRGTSLERLMDEIIATQNGGVLDRAKAIYSIITDNGLEPSTFFEHLTEGNSIQFAQYKRNYNMNFVDTKYYRDKIESQVFDQDLSK